MLHATLVDLVEQETNKMKFTEISVSSMGITAYEECVLSFIGSIAGECYNSSKDIDKCVTRALNCISRGHHSPFEHYNITLKCVVDRGTSHALVRHRHCAFQQSSTIYQKFDEIVLIAQDDWQLYEIPVYDDVEQTYKTLIKNNVPPHRARDVLPNSLATNLIITTNIRQWMYMLQRRCGPGDSDNMHKWCSKTREWFEKTYPKITGAFDTWYKKHPI